MNKVLEEKKYSKSVEGFSMFSDNKVEIIGERKVILEDGRTVEQYLYNIVGYEPENKKPFVSLKANIILI